MSNFPATAKETTFGELVSIVSTNNKKVQKREYLQSGRFPVVDQGQQFIGGYCNDESKVILEDLPLLVFGDHTRTFKYLDQPFVPGADGVKVLKPLGVSAKWLYHIAHALDFPDKGYARHFQHLKNAKLRVPPLPDQRRIVEEIEKQFSHLEVGMTALRRVQANLKRYRAAVLKAACEGRLVPTEAELATAEGRTYETGEQLLARILAGRRKNWRDRGKYKEPVAPDTTNLPQLLLGWTWASLDQLLELMRNGISAKPDAASGLPILRISAVRALSVNLEDIRYLNADASGYSDYVLAAGDLLFTRYNGNPDLVGVCGVVPPLASHLVHPDKLIRCKLVASGALPHFVAMMANVGASRDYLATRVRTTAGQAGISGGDLKSQPIPVPPLAEQIRIVAEVERRLSVIEELEAAVVANLQRATRLRQSILQQAISKR